LCGKIHKKTDKHSHTQEHTEKEREKRQTERYLLAGCLFVLQALKQISLLDVSHL